MQTRNTIFTMKTPFAIILSQANESWGEAICRLCGVIIQASRRVSTSGEFWEKADLWITEYTITYQGRPAYTVSIMEFRDGKVVHETQYFGDPFEAPAWRSQWVQRME
jgi:hypothetical protein